MPFLVPAFALTSLLILWPVAQTMAASFTSWFVSDQRPFIGLANYQKLLDDAVFWRSVLNTAILAVGGAAVIFPVALVIAHVVTGPGIGRAVARLVIIAPIALTPVAAALVWKLSLDPNFGIANGLLRSLGLDDLAQPWLGLRWSAPIAVILATVWWLMGVYVLLLSAAIGAIPSEIRDAARVDGATRLAAFRYVTLPLIWGMIRVLLVLWVASAVAAFAVIDLLTGGGPFRSTEVIATYLAKVAFGEQRFGYAAAIATVATIMLFVVTGLVNRITRREAIEY